MEHYHGTLRSAYNHINEASEFSILDVACLQIALKVVNDNVGAERLFPRLLMSGGMPCLARNEQSARQFQRARLLQEAKRAFLHL